MATKKSDFKIFSKTYSYRKTSAPAPTSLDYQDTSGSPEGVESAWDMAGNPRTIEELQQPSPKKTPPRRR